ncbi:MAG: hypothetical protein NC102_00170 [Clostridium sp.]|nr:hypothetical protein [Clostridium sp.]
MENNLNLTAKAVQAIEALQHNAGTYSYYRDALQRIFRHILIDSDEVGMSSYEALATLRALNAISDDLRAIAGVDLPVEVDEDDEEEESEEELDEPGELKYDLGVASGKLREAIAATEEAACHAERSGAAYDIIASEISCASLELDECAAKFDRLLEKARGFGQEGETDPTVNANSFLCSACGYGCKTYELAQEALRSAYQSDDFTPRDREELEKAVEEAKRSAARIDAVTAALHRRLNSGSRQEDANPQ